MSASAIPGLLGILPKLMYHAKPLHRTVSLLAAEMKEEQCKKDVQVCKMMSNVSLMLCQAGTTSSLYFK